MAGQDPASRQAGLASFSGPPGDDQAVACAGFRQSCGSGGGTLASSRLPQQHLGSAAAVGVVEDDSRIIFGDGHDKREIGLEGKEYRVHGDEHVENNP